MKGLFITFEGIEGAGKSTQIECLRAWLLEEGHQADVTREPGGTPIAEAVRGLLLDPAHTEMDPRAELLLYEASRAQHVAERVQPAIQSGAMVLCDRFIDSTVAYQGHGRGVSRAELDSLNAFATGGLAPDITFLFDLPAEEGLRRALRDREADRIEQESLTFHTAVREGFLTIAAAEPERFRVLDALQAPEAISAQMIDAVRETLAARRG